MYATIEDMEEDDEKHHFWYLKATEQKNDSLQEWYATMAAEHGKKKAQAMRSRLLVLPSRRSRNNPKQIMPGAVFVYQGIRHVLRAQKNNGYYWLAVGQGNREFKEKECTVVKQNRGIGER